MMEIYYPHLIREFYGSMAQGGEGWIAEVRGIQIPMFAKMISRVWEIPICGPIANSLGDWIIGFRCILKRDDV